MAVGTPMYASSYAVKFMKLPIIRGSEVKKLATIPIADPAPATMLPLLSCVLIAVASKVSILMLELVSFRCNEL